MPLFSCASSYLPTKQNAKNMTNKSTTFHTKTRWQERDWSNYSAAEKGIIEDCFHDTDCICELLQKCDILIIARLHHKWRLFHQPVIPQLVSNMRILFLINGIFANEIKKKTNIYIYIYIIKTIQNNNNHNNNKNANPCSKLSTARWPCLCNISWIQANWFKTSTSSSIKHTKTRKSMWPWPLTYDLNIH